MIVLLLEFEIISYLVISFFLRERPVTYIENSKVQTLIIERTLRNHKNTKRSLPLLSLFFLRIRRHQKYKSRRLEELPNPSDTTTDNKPKEDINSCTKA